MKNTLRRLLKIRVIESLFTSFNLIHYAAHAVASPCLKMVLRRSTLLDHRFTINRQFGPFGNKNTSVNLPLTVRPWLLKLPQSKILITATTLPGPLSNGQWCFSRLINRRKTWPRASGFLIGRSAGLSPALIVPSSPTTVGFPVTWLLTTSNLERWHPVEWVWFWWILNVTELWTLFFPAVIVTYGATFFVTTVQPA